MNDASLADYTLADGVVYLELIVNGFDVRATDSPVPGQVEKGGVGADSVKLHDSDVVFLVFFQGAGVLGCFHFPV